jgi:hypothetical protein
LEGGSFSSAWLAPPTFLAWSMTMLERTHRLMYRVSRRLLISRRAALLGGPIAA